MDNAFRTWKSVHSCRLYHYEKFCPSWLETTLREGKIHCADPDKLNDPWDCKPFFFKRSDASGPAESWDSLSLGLQGEIAKRRIYCLAEDPLSTLMWSHYAADHTGICLEFHLSNFLFMKVRGVVYDEQFPAIVPNEFFDRALDMILTKAKCWEYEREFRLIGGPHFQEGEPLKTYDDFFKLPPLALMSVIVGCRGDYDAVQKVVNANAPSLRVTRIVRAPNEYKLLMGLPDPGAPIKTISWPPNPPKKQ
jgi:hypothetical protein